MTHDTLHVTPTPTASDHPPSNSPTMHTKLVHQGRGCMIQNEKKLVFVLLKTIFLSVMFWVIKEEVLPLEGSIPLQEDRRKICAFWTDTQTVGWC